MTGNRHDRKDWPGNAKAWLGNAKNRAFRSPIEKPAETPVEKQTVANDRLIEATVISDPRQLHTMGGDGAAYAYEPDSTVYRTNGYAGFDGHEYPYDEDDSDPVLDALALGLAGPRQRVSDLEWIIRVRR